MRLRVLHATLVVLLGLSCGSGLFAQTAGQPPSVGDLKEEQRIIGFANLGDAEFQIKTARERLGANKQPLAQQSGLWALEQLAYAKRRLERHAPRIEEARGIFGRASESTRKDLRESYGKLRERYVDVEERLDGLAGVLQKAGFPLLGETLDRVRSSGGEGAVSAVKEALSKAGQQGRGDQAGGADGAPAAAPVAMPSAAPAAGPAGIPGVPGSSASQTDANHVSVTIPGVGTVEFTGTLSADGRYVDSPEFGRIDLASGRLMPDGSIAFQSDKGLVVRGPDGRWHLVPGAQLNADGSVTTADGKHVSLASALGGGAAYQPKPGDTFIDAKTGKRITVGPDWDGDKQGGVSKDYIGGPGGALVAETKVTRQIVGGSDGAWKVEETPGESRSWNFSIRLGDQQTANGAVTLTISVDGGGGGGFKITSWEIVDDSGNRASVTPSSSNPNEATVVISKGGQYTFNVSGQTDWGSPFKVKTQGGIYP